MLMLGGLFAKAIGAFYRIPLANLLGGYGMGLYQMAYPLFCVLLTFSSTGIPSALSRTIAGETARGEEDGGTVKSACKLFALLGLVGSLLMCLVSPLMATLQQDESLRFCYFMLAPSVFLVALIAVLRGYFQGKRQMAPTALSEIVEQIVKAGVGLFFAYRYRANPALAAAYTLFAVTMSEVVALFFLFLCYKREWHVRRLRVRTPSGFSILALAVPVMAAASLLPLSQTVDSIVIVRLLSGYSDNAVGLYGLLSGGALALVGLPATVCYGLAAAAVPSVSAATARGETDEARRRAMYALSLTLLCAVPCSLGLLFLARPIVALLYPALSQSDAVLLVKLVRLTAISATFLAGVDTLAACLTGMGRAKRAAGAMFIAVVAKFILQFLLVSDPRFGIAGAAAAANLCYLIAFFLDLLYTMSKEKKHDYDYRSRRRRQRAESQPCGNRENEGGGRGALPHSGRSHMGA